MDIFPQTVSCACGQVKYLATGSPIVTAVCYCEDCQAAGEIMSRVDGVQPFQGADGGTPYVTLHDKNWVFVEGEDKLEAIKLNPKSPTTRYVTTCCRSPIFIKFKSGFWTSTYRERYVRAPALEWRNMTSKRRSSLPYPDNIPRFRHFPLRLFGRLAKAYVRKSPK